HLLYLLVHRCRARPLLHSFPTRRSSDLDERHLPAGRAHPLPQLEREHGAHALPGEGALRRRGRCLLGVGGHRRSASRDMYACSSSPLTGASEATGTPAATAEASRRAAAASSASSTSTEVPPTGASLSG